MAFGRSWGAFRAARRAVMYGGSRNRRQSGPTLHVAPRASGIGIKVRQVFFALSILSLLYLLFHH